MVSLPEKGGKRVSLLRYFSCPVYPHDCQEREEVRSKSMLCNDLGPGQDPKPSFVVVGCRLWGRTDSDTTEAT